MVLSEDKIVFAIKCLFCLKLNTSGDNWVKKKGNILYYTSIMVQQSINFTKKKISTLQQKSENQKFYYKIQTIDVFLFSRQNTIL